MEPCIYCSALTKLYNRDHPTCVGCSDLLNAGKPPARRPEPATKPSNVLFVPRYRRDQGQRPAGLKSD